MESQVPELDPELDSRNGDNRLRPEDAAVHDWYRFVLSFPPHLVREYVDHFGIKRGHVVLDPFCGTGTTLVECKKNRISCIGFEPNPMAHFATKVKIDWRVEPDRLWHHACEVARVTTEKLAMEGVADSDTSTLPDTHGLTSTPLRTLPPNAAKLLLKNSISPIPLNKSLALLETIDEQADDRFTRYENLALAHCLQSEVSNLRFGPEVGVGVLKTDAPVVSVWLERVQAMVSDLATLRSDHDGMSSVHKKDARLLTDILEPNSVDAVITSPPYPNEKDYTRTTRLESVILRFMRDRQDLRTVKQMLIRSNTRGVYKGDSDDTVVAFHEEVQRVAHAIENRRVELNKTSGFERLYARVAKLYFGGMARHLADIRQVLTPGAQLAYVVGDQASYLRVMIRTGQILADIAQSLGYELVNIDLFRTRQSTVTGDHLREEVVVLTWPGHESR